jgi:hypothetical protein
MLLPSIGSAGPGFTGADVPLDGYADRSIPV